MDRFLEKMILKMDEVMLQGDNAKLKVMGLMMADYINVVNGGK